jgi:hypothetical protein
MDIAPSPSVTACGSCPCLPCSSLAVVSILLPLREDGEASLAVGASALLSPDFAPTILMFTSSILLSRGAKRPSLSLSVSFSSAISGVPCSLKRLALLPLPLLLVGLCSGLHLPLPLSSSLMALTALPSPAASVEQASTKCTGFPSFLCASWTALSRNSFHEKT